MAMRRRPMKTINSEPHYLCAGKCTLGWLPQSKFPPSHTGLCPVRARCHDCSARYQRERYRNHGPVGVKGKAGPNSRRYLEQAADAERISKLVAERRQSIDVMPILAESAELRDFCQWRRA